MEIEKCHLYVLPPGQYAEIKEGKLALKPRPPGGANHSADVLFRTLGTYYRENSIGVDLSRSEVEAEGKEGIIAIKDNGGHTYAQEPSTAQFSGMPDAAIRTGKVDFIMTPAEIGNELTLVSWAS